MAEKNETSWEKKFEDKMKHMEKRIEEVGKNVESKGEAFGKRVEERAQQIAKDVKKEGRKTPGLFWGIVLIVVGFIWLGDNLGWFWYDVPWIPIIMLVVGIFLVLKNWHRGKSNNED
jgi:hypothetical protein